MIKRSFYFIRHGETDWNAKGIMQGHTDIPLNEKGIAQAHTAGLYLSAMQLPITRLITSGLSRAQKTAEIIDIHLKLSQKLIYEPLLNERHFGDFEGKTKNEVDAYRANHKEKFLNALEENGFPPIPNGERYADFKARIVSNINKFLDAHADDQVLFVLHGGVYNVLTRLHGFEINAIENAKPYFFEKDHEEKWHLHPL